MTEETANKTGRSGKHAGDRMLVTLDKEIYEAFANMAQLEGLPPATKARQILTMYVNNVTLVPKNQFSQPSVADSITSSNNKTKETVNEETTENEKSDFIIDNNKPKMQGLKRHAK